MNRAVIQIDSLVVRRGDFMLNHASLSVGERETVVILGPTGSGKTLLLESVAGFIRPNGGKVLFKGLSVGDIPINRRSIGYLFQEYKLFPHMTVAENIGYSLKIRRISNKERSIRVCAVAERFGLTSILKQYPGTLSGGEQQRTALARALLSEPGLLLLDEPFSALDPVTRERMYTIFSDIQASFGCSVLMVTHDFREAQRLADRVCILNKGELSETVPPEQLFSCPWKNEIKQFLGIEKGLK